MAGRLVLLLVGLLLLSSAAPCSANPPPATRAHFSAPADPCKTKAAVAKACPQLGCQVFDLARTPVVFVPASRYRAADPLAAEAWAGQSPSPPVPPPRSSIL
jgi:hypothetical protein